MALSIFGAARTFRNLAQKSTSKVNTTSDIKVLKWQIESWILNPTFSSSCKTLAIQWITWLVNPRNCSQFVTKKHGNFTFRTPKDVSQQKLDPSKNIYWTFLQLNYPRLTMAWEWQPKILELPQPLLAFGSTLDLVTRPPLTMVSPISLNTWPLKVLTRELRPP